MISAAFYAPMKAPDHPVPSGDRAMARALIQALSAAGIQAEVASTFQSRESKGCTSRQSALLDQARSEAKHVIQIGQSAGWAFWMTYHNYYKAPDLLGPRIAKALGIPYILVEATRARKRLGGAWDRFAQAAEDATDAAQAVFYLTEHDAEALHAYAPPNQRLIHLKPFLPRAELPPQSDRTADMLAVGMFRAGDKLASYQIIADTLKRVEQQDWQLDIAGDGPERAKVETMMQRFGKRVRFLGALDAQHMEAAYGRARILFWPGVNEAFGMAYLEAQAAGLTVLAQDRPGVRDVVFQGASYPAVELGASALAHRLALLLSTPKLSERLGIYARAYIAQHHLLGPAQDTLQRTLDGLMK